MIKLLHLVGASRGPPPTNAYFLSVTKFLQKFLPKKLIKFSKDFEKWQIFNQFIISCKFFITFFKFRKLLCHLTPKSAPYSSPLVELASTRKLPECTNESVYGVVAWAGFGRLNFRNPVYTAITNQDVKRTLAIFVKFRK